MKKQLFVFPFIFLVGVLFGLTSAVLGVFWEERVTMEKEATSRVQELPEESENIPSEKVSLKKLEIDAFRCKNHVMEIISGENILNAYYIGTSKEEDYALIATREAYPDNKNPEGTNNLHLLTCSYTPELVWEKEGTNMTYSFLQGNEEILIVDKTLTVDEESYMEEIYFTSSILDIKTLTEKQIGQFEISKLVEGGSMSLMYSRIDSVSPDNKHALIATGYEGFFSLLLFNIETGSYRKVTDEFPAFKGTEWLNSTNFVYMARDTDFVCESPFDCPIKTVTSDIYSF